MPFDPNTAPTDADITALLQSAGLLSSSLPAIYTGIGAGALVEFGKRTGWTPFLKDEEDVTRHFSPNGTSFIDLQGGLFELTEITFDEDTAVDPAFYKLMEPDAPNDGLPYTYLLFTGGVYGEPGTINVTGKWGRVESFDFDVWLAVCEIGALMVAPGLSATSGGSSGDIKEVKVDDVTIKYDNDDSNNASGEDRSQIGRWKAHVSSVVNRYKRRGVS